ncbi:restriction endonuclease subunit S [Vibrio paracholerae]|uniref:restriction endonuclease subunit S n=1 Tax=Vibrio paracholerae TaxID=650003 RepID=UPI000DE30981|nr:restriction endonuclease subunit S [Vibrio paracholerae]RBM58336.1 restriction endonuclease subunit S [Vibrio paracholerae]
MSCNWPNVALGKYCSKIGSGATPKGGNSVYLDSGEITLIRSQNIYNEGFKSDGLVYITPEAAQKLKNVIIEPNDVLINITGDSVARVCLAPKEHLPARVNQHVAIIRVDPKEFDHRYLRYYLTSLKMQSYLLTIASSGATRNALTKSMLESLEVSKPPLDIQKKIGDVLEQFENKIQLNTQTNQTLEEMAQAIFKSWFVDFDPVKAKMNGEQPEGMDAVTASLFPEKLVESELGLTPEGWNLSEIGDEVTVVGGGTPSKKNDDFWVDGHIHWTSPKDLSGVQDKVLLDTASKLTEAGLKKVSSGLLPVDTVLLSSRAPVGYLALAKVPLAVNQGYIAMKCEKVLPPEFVLQWCVHRMDEIKQRASGSTFAEISKKNFKPISVVVPSEEVLIAYKKLVKPLYDAITSNVRQSEQLSTLRDTLLPKLLSGAVTISE